MKIGYINRHDLKLNPHLKERFKFIEANAADSDKELAELLEL